MSEDAEWVLERLMRVSEYMLDKELMSGERFGMSARNIDRLTDGLCDRLATGDPMTRLDRYLREHGVSRSRLAREAGLSLRTVSAICEGRSGGRHDTWALMARALGCRIGEIVGD